MPTPSFPEVNTSIFNPTQESVDDVLQKKKHAKPLNNHSFLGTNGSLLDLGDGRLLKHGHRVTLLEARAMEFVRENTTIPIPKIHMAFERNGVDYIVMEIIEGYTLAAAFFENLEDDDFDSIFRSIHDVQRQIRDLGSRLGRSSFGSWPAGPYRNTYFVTRPPAAEFISLDEFHAYWLERFASDYFVANGPAIPYLESIIANNDHPQQSTLSHGDFSAFNILIKDKRMVAVIDWEMFGWYPEIWDTMFLEMTCMTSQGQEAMDREFGDQPDLAKAYAFALSELHNPMYRRS